MTNVLVTGDLTIQNTSTGFPNQSKVAILRDVKSSGTGAGTPVSGIQDRTLNTVLDPYNIVTLDAGNVLFNFDELGTYLVQGSCTVYHGLRNRIFFTDSSNNILIYGSSTYGTPAAPDGVMKLRFSGIITVTSTSDQYKIRHYIQTPGGLGVPNSSGEDEVYVQCVVMKL